MGCTSVTSAFGAVRNQTGLAAEAESILRLTVYLKAYADTKRGFSAAGLSGRYLYIAIPPHAVG